MRILVPLLLLAAVAAPAAAQRPTAILDAMRRDFPVDHARLTAAPAGESAEAARKREYRAIDNFLALRGKAILRAPGPALVAIEARQAALLRALERHDVRLCATIGDKGFFSEAALAAPPLPGLEDYGLALVAAAKAGEIGGPEPPPPAREDLTAWITEVERIAPGIPFARLLSDPVARSAAPPEQLCRGAAAMHEAVGRLPAAQGERIARVLLRAVTSSGR